MKSVLKSLLIASFNSLLVMLIFLSPLSYGKEDYGYKYTLKNYFSKRKPNAHSYQGSPRSLSLYFGTSLQGETEDKKLGLLSSRLLGFSQRIRDFPTIGDWNLNLEIHSMALAVHTKKPQREILLNISSTFSVPDIRSGFPVFVGAGGSFGLFPRHIIKQKPAISVGAQIFTGFRILDWYKNVGLQTSLNLKMYVPFNDKKLYMELIANFGFLFSF